MKHSISSTNNVEPSQTATLTLGDNIGVTKYYFGKNDPLNSNVEWTNSTATSITKTVDSSGVWYVGVQDAAGNKNSASKTFYKTTLDSQTPVSGKGAVSPTSVLTLSGNSFTIPTPEEIPGYTFRGWYKEAACTTSAGDTWTPTADATLYAKWTANTPVITIKENGVNAITTGYSVSLSTSQTEDTASYTATSAGATVSFRPVVNGTYYIWSGYS